MKLGTSRKTDTLFELYITVILFITLINSATAQQSIFRLAPLFTDNVVLQQQTEAPIWGKGNPGTEIVIQTSWGKKIVTKVKPDSTWMAKVQTPKAGGPFQISLRHANSLVVLRNVLVGEVWLCSGQSNMEMPLEGWSPSDTIAKSAIEIEKALYPTVRLFTVVRAAEPSPNDVCVGKWVECSPVDVRNFSATAFFFGKTLSATLKVPIGLINSSYGGTFVEAWMSKQALQAFPQYSEQLTKIESCRENIKSLTGWIVKHPAVNIHEEDPAHKWEGLKFQDEHCSERNFNDSIWKEMKLPVYWEQTSMGEFDGAVWFRKQITIPGSWVGKNLTLQLGPIDDMDETYVNSKLVGSYLDNKFWKTDRVYKVPGDIVRDSIMQIAVRVLDIGGGGGIWGNGTKMILYKDDAASGMSLEGNWKYLPVAELLSNVFYVFGADGQEYFNRPKFPIQFSQNTPTSLFNGMITPLIPFAIKGVIWYQGENNVSNANLYSSLFTAMIIDWRRAFSSGDFPFYYVQIAPYDYGKQSHSELLREAQMQTLALKNTGMVVISDIGNPKNIHPANKEGVGKRLANWALAKTYGKRIAYSGPLYKSMKIQKNKIVLSFDYTGKGLVLKNSGSANNFLIAGSDMQFKNASMKIQGNKLVVSNPEIPKPQAVRYAFTDTSEATLFNKDGLPASSFRTDK